MVDRRELPDEIPIPRARRLEDFRRGPLPIIVWIIAALVGFWMLGQRHASGGYIGLARPTEVDISAAADGVVAELFIDLFEAVEAGQAVAALDSTLLEAQIATLRAEIDQQHAEVRARTARLSADMAAADRAWNAEARDEAEQRFEVLALRGELETDRIEAQRLDLELERAERLLNERVVSQAAVDSARLDRARLGERIAQNEAMLARATADLEELEEQRRRLVGENPATETVREPALEAVRLAAEVHRRRLEELEVARRGLVLRAAIDGHVHQILARPGQTVQPGQPLMTIVAATSDEVVVYLPEGAGTIDVATPVRVVNGTKGIIAEAVVESLSPKIDLLPPRLWPHPERPSYGRSARLSTLPDLDLTPGQIVRILPID